MEEESQKDKVIRHMKSVIDELKDQLNQQTTLLERERSENIQLSRLNSDLERRLEIVTKDLFTLESEKKDLMKRIDNLQSQLDTVRRYVPKQDHVAGGIKRKRKKTTSKRKKQKTISADETANNNQTDDELALIKKLIDRIVNSTISLLSRSGNMIDSFIPVEGLIANKELKEEVKIILESIDNLFPKFTPIEQYDDISIRCLISFSTEIMKMLKKFSDVTKIILESTEESAPVIKFNKEVKKVSIAEEELKLALKTYDEFNPMAKTGEIDDVQVEEKKKAFVIQTKIPACLENCQPQIMADSYLHFINMETLQPIPVENNPMNRPMKNPGEVPQTFGILSSKKLPQINSFPIFTKIGKIKIDVTVCKTTIKLTDAEMTILKEFHEFLFSDVLNVEKTLEFDPLCGKMNFYIVPVHSDLEPSYIDWKFIEEINASDFKEVLKNLQKPKTYINSEVTEDSVFIKPYKMWIKKTLPTYHHVIKLTEKTPKSLIDFESISQTIEQYYKIKYKISIKDKNQKLWETFSDGICVSSKPLENIKLYNSKLDKNRESIKKYKEYLVPELCYCCPFKSMFLLKSVYLRIIINRVTRLLLAEELKDKIEEKSMEKFTEKSYKFFDISKKEDTMTTFNDIEKLNINIFLEKENNSGPSPGDILTGITLKAACDAFDLERSEFLGDSFLKFLTTFHIYMIHPDYSNDQMNTLRTDIVKNENLFNKACEKNINKYLITKPFQELGAWIPPCFKESELDKNKKMEVSSTTLSHKKIADSVEALIGVYLTSCGPKGAEMFMTWAGLTLEEIITGNKLQNFGFILTENDFVNLEEINVVEDKIKYCFKNKTLIQIALTPYKNDNTYEKLFIIGNCVLDLLVSCYLYEDGQQFEPAELTKARSLTLQKINLACIALKYKFHEQMIDVPQNVKQGISEMEKSSCFKFFKDLGCAVNEIHYPKNRPVQLLSQVLQSIAAAVLLDNNMNWNAVWKIYFPILEQSLKYVIKTIRKKKAMQKKWKNIVKKN